MSGKNERVNRGTDDQDRKQDWNENQKQNRHCIESRAASGSKSRAKPRTGWKSGPAMIAPASQFKQQIGSIRQRDVLPNAATRRTPVCRL
ncbi:hypothetical protein EVAR_36076_1 [Eumeta japonica]|uniref:Uncharacterized protein n=1 Tax=Eumeta variegata TaxID=151549 RepID=A0A4C1YET0_EUMVA|nr:hypothetical protein EVAR_36076_1 [Eumeta japonica]